MCYLKVKKNLINHSMISPDCKFLIIYLLAKGEFYVNISQLQMDLKKFWGRDKIYLLINEAIFFGYLKRIDVECEYKIFKNGQYIISNRKGRTTKTILVKEDE